MSVMGIICAGDDELAPFFDYIKDDKVTKKAMLEFHEGILGGAKVVALYSGVCKVNAAVAAQILIDAFGVDMIINAGTAGGMDSRVNIFDTIVGERTAYHDVADDILTDFHPWLDTVFFKADERLLDVARAVGRISDHPVLFGTIVTGEQFIEDDQRSEINGKFAPLAVDMESAAIAHVCHVNGIPFVSVRTVTDTADHKGVENFERNCRQASGISAGFVVDMIGMIDGR